MFFKNKYLFFGTFLFIGFLFFSGSAQAALPGAPTVTPDSVLWPEELDFQIALVDDGGEALDHFVVEYTLAGQNNWQLFSPDPTAVGWVYVTSLPQDTDYEVRVAAVNASGQGPYSTVTPISTAYWGDYEGTDMLGCIDGNGDPDFYSNSNCVGTDSLSFNTASGIALDQNHHRLFVADGGRQGQDNNRIMVFNLNSDNTPIDHEADYVLGQSDFVSSSNGLGADKMKGPRNVFYDNKYDRLFVSDTFNNRVLVFDGNNIATGMAATYVLGQSDFVSNGSVVSSPTFTGSGLDDMTIEGLYTGTSAKTYTISILTEGNPDEISVSINGVVQYSTIVELSRNLGDGLTLNFGSTTGHTAGDEWTFTASQSDKTTQNNLWWPMGMDMDESGDWLYLAEMIKSNGSDGNNRVVAFDVRPAGSSARSRCGTSTTGIANGMDASCVIGQPDFTTRDRAIAQNRFSEGPRDVAYDSVNEMLYVAASEDYRVIGFDVRNAEVDNSDKTMCGYVSNGLVNGMNASCVLGQPDFDTADWGGWGNPAQNYMANARGLWFDATNDWLFVADHGNGRVLRFDDMTNPSNGMDASAAYGVPDFETENSSSWGRYNFAYPNAVLFDEINSRLYLVDNDTSWSRVLVFDLVAPSEPINIGPTSEKFEADIVSGFISVAGNDPTGTSAVTFNVEYTIIAGSAQVIIPAGTQMTRTGGGSLDFTDMDFEDITSALQNANTVNIAGAVSLGIAGLNLTFSEPIEITIPVGDSYNGQTISIYFQNEGQVDWTGGLSCIVADGLCVFETDHATTYSAGDEPAGGEVVVEEVEKADVKSWSATRYDDPGSKLCTEKLELKIKGDHFESGAKVRIGEIKAFKVKRSSDNRITAKFCFNKLVDKYSGKEKKVSVENKGADRDNAKKRFKVSRVTYPIDTENFNPNTAEGVKNIQRALIKLGYLEPQYVTGYYGPLTTDAVRRFQADNGLPQAGVVGPETTAKLKEKA